MILNHKPDVYAVESTANDVTIRERIERVPNEYNHGHHNEHHSITRSRALAHARAVFPGAPQVTLSSAHVTRIGRSEWRVYYINGLKN